MLRKHVGKEKKQVRNHVLISNVKKWSIKDEENIKNISWLERKDEHSKQEYQNTVRETTKLCRKKKREWLNQIVAKSQEDRTANNTKDFYRTIRFFKKGFTPNAYGIKDKDG